MFFIAVINIFRNRLFTFIVFSRNRSIFYFKNVLLYLPTLLDLELSDLK